MATGRGAAFAIDLKVRARVELNDGGDIRARIIGEPDESTALMERCVRKMLDRVDQGYGAEVETESNLPVARGLSSSSACSNAVVLATSSALEKLGFETPTHEALINTGIDASIETGVTVTGAFDDASASYYGGASVTDNATRKILRRESMPDMVALVLVPEERSYSGGADVEAIRLLGPQVEMAHKEAVQGDLLRAMTLNGIIYCASLGYDPTPALLALRAGAKAAGLTGKGPAFVALADDGDSVEEAWKALGVEVVETRTNNLGSKVLE